MKIWILAGLGVSVLATDQGDNYSLLFLKNEMVHLESARLITENGIIVGQIDLENPALWSNGIITSVSREEYLRLDVFAINERGAYCGNYLIGYYSGGVGGPSPITRGFSVIDNNLLELETFGGYANVAVTISKDSSLVAGWASDSKGNYHPVLWRDGKVTNLNSVIVEGPKVDQPWRITKSGSIICIGTNQNHVVLLTPLGASSYRSSVLFTNPVNGSSIGDYNDFNDSGEFVGIAPQDGSSEGFRSFVQRTNGWNWIHLDPKLTVRPSSINAHGFVVGNYQSTNLSPNQPFRAFLSRGDLFLDLNDLRNESFGDYVLRGANAINDQNQIAGDAFRYTEEEGSSVVGYLLTPKIKLELESDTNLIVRAFVPSSFSIDFSPDLKSWTTLTNRTNSNTIGLPVDSSRTNGFFRGVLN